MPIRLLPTILALAMTVGAGALPSALAQAPTATTGVTVTAAPAASGTLQPGQDLVVTATVANGTAATVSGATAQVFLGHDPISSQAALATWRDADQDQATAATGVLLAEQPLIDLAPGQRQSMSFTIAAAAIGLDGRPWGVHPLSVLVSAAGAPLSTAHSSVIWYPSTANHATRLAIVAPLTAPPQPTGLIAADALATYTAPGGLLERQLNQAIGRRVTLAIDPMILASIRILGSSAPPSAIQWLDRLDQATNETFALSYADADIAATSQAGSPAPLAPTSFVIDPSLFAPPTQEPTPAPTPSQTPSPSTSPSPSEIPVPPLPTPESLLNWEYTLTGVAWPGEDTVSDKDLAAFGAAASSTTILSSTNASYAESAPVQAAAAKIGDAPVTISDSSLSRLLRAAVQAPTDMDWQAALTELSSAIAMLDRLSASPRTLVATLGRDSPSPNYRLEATLDVLESEPWVATTRLGDALAASPAKATLVGMPEDPTRVSTVAAMLDSELRVSQFSSVLDDPTLETGPRRLALLAALSHSWDSDPTGWTAVAGQYLAENNAIVASVSVVESSTITLTADNGNLPIAVSNSLDHAVTVYVTVRPQRAILNVVDLRVPVKVEAGSQARVFIPVQSVANGQVTTDVSLSSMTGVPISQPVLVQINVQAGWETLITVIISVLLVLLFGFGIYRNIAKRRRAIRDEAAAEDTAATASIAGEHAEPTAADPIAPRELKPEQLRD